jgi:TfoX/Sxy family transcriptional regulator of competence genes
VAYDEELADRIRAYAPVSDDATEMKMFGGIAWMLRGHMYAGITRSSLMVPVGRDGMDEAIARGAKPMTMGSKTMAGFVTVDDPTDEQLAEWIGASVERVAQLPPKEKKPKRATA